MHSAHYAKTTIKRRTHLGSSPHSSLTAAKKKEKKSNKNFPKHISSRSGRAAPSPPHGGGSRASAVLEVTSVLSEGDSVSRRSFQTIQEPERIKKSCTRPPILLPNM